MAHEKLNIDFVNSRIPYLPLRHQHVPPFPPGNFIVWPKTSAMPVAMLYHT
jgi:hypothetical protein